MNLPNNEKGHFGKKTVRYLEKNIYSLDKNNFKTEKELLTKNTNMARESVATIIEYKASNDFKMNSINWKYHNDNFTNILNGFERVGLDTGKTFGGEGDYNFDLGERQWNLNIDYSHYTEGEIFADNNKSGTTKTTKPLRKTDNATRKDLLKVGLTTKIYGQKNNSGDYLDIYGGGGVSYFGDLGGGEIQKARHKNLGIYEHKGKNDGGTGFDGFIDVNIAAKKYIYGNKERGVYSKASAGAKISFTDNGEHVLKGEGGLGLNYGPFGVEGGIYGELSTGIKSTNTINSRESRGVYFKASTKVLGVDGLTLSYKYKDNIYGEDRYPNLAYKPKAGGQGTMALEYKF
ncbi:MAG: hypothetical protein Q9M94_05760 [Candidatus Gracilibacteria bacterium]|nr:hypothetical protein [Candidatus Gracilibacteria bacterium]MDQ7022572.1 hypothetical protein [Candidatus Gracilibacteria bacterium]